MGIQGDDGYGGRNSGEDRLAEAAPVFTPGFTVDASVEGARSVPVLNDVSRLPAPHIPAKDGTVTLLRLPERTPVTFAADAVHVTDTQYLLTVGGAVASQLDRRDYELPEEHTDG